MLYDKKILLLSASLILTINLGGCDKKEEFPEHNVVPVEETIDSEVGQEQSRDNPNNELSTANTNVNDNEELEQDLQISQIPLDQYHDFNQDSDLAWLTPLFIAQSPKQFSDEEKLDLLSAEYYNENDAFKKKDLAKNLMPEIEEEIAKYEGDYRIKVPIVRNAKEFYQKQREMNLTTSYTNTLSIHGPYDFESKSFPVAHCNEIDWGKRNEQNIEIHTIHSDRARKMETSMFRPVLTDCSLEVSDEQLAREIEDVRSNNNLQHRGNLYYKLKATNRFIEAYPVFAEVTYYNKETGEDLISKDFHYAIEKVEY